MNVLNVVSFNSNLYSAGNVVANSNVVKKAGIKLVDPITEEMINATEFKN